MPSVLFVCTANMCRSPMAEVIFRALVADREEGMQWSIASAGTHASTGEPATNYSIQVAAERGLDLKRHASRPVDHQLLDTSDLVLVMEPGHQQLLRDLFPGHAHRVHLLSEMAGEDRPVHDPVGTTLDNYRAMADRVHDLLERGLERIKSLAARRSRP